MTNPWKDPNCNTIYLENHPFFKKLSSSSITEIKESSILFAGSCDISGVKFDRYWHEIFCEERKLEHDKYAYIGAALYGLPSLVRRIYDYLKLIDSPPKELLLVSPVATPEHLINDILYPINHRAEAMSFLYRANIVPKELSNRTTKLQEAYSESFSTEQAVYNFCKEFSFLEMICKAYNIRFYWTTNLTWNSHFFFDKLDLFLEAHDFARDTFIGSAKGDIEYNREYDSPTASAHRSIASLFLNSDAALLDNKERIS